MLAIFATIMAPLTSSCHDAFVPTGTQSYGNLTLAMGEIPIGEPGTNMRRVVVCAPIHNIRWDDASDLSGHNVSFSLMMQSTQLYSRWPVGHPNKRCTTVLETNILAPADCPAFDTCGPMTWTVIEERWYGKEIGICIGAGSQHTTVTPKGVYYHGGLPATDWGQVYTFRLADRFNDPNSVINGLMLIRFQSRDILFQSEVYHNFVVLGSDTASLYNLQHNASGSMACPTILPAARVNDGLIYDGPTLHDWPPGVPINVPRERRMFKPRYWGHSISTTRLNSTHLAKMNFTNVWSFIEDPEPQVCLPHSYVTAYAFPGHTWLRSALTTVANILVDVLLSILTTLYLALSDTLRVINDTYRFNEICVVTALVVWRYDSIWKGVLAASAYALVIGLHR